MREKSCYHLSSIPIIHELAELLPDDRDLLLLSPFRPQRSIHAALAFDLKSRFPGKKISASTIHRSQGSESGAVILDLTTHSSDKLVAFFRDSNCSKLFNVGISRAQDDLIILGNHSMIQALASEQPFWNGVRSALEGSINVVSADELLEEPVGADELESQVLMQRPKMLPPCIAIPTTGNRQVG